MPAKKDSDAPVAKVELTYPGADGKKHTVKAGKEITDAEKNWPPDWVVDSGWVQMPQKSDDEPDSSSVTIKKGDA